MKTFVFVSFLALLVGNAYSGMPYAKNLVYCTLAQLDVQSESNQPTTTTSLDGALKISITGGTPPYAVQIMSSTLPSQSFNQDHIKLSNIGVGTYLVIVQDYEKHVVQKHIELTAKK